MSDRNQDAQSVEDRLEAERSPYEPPRLGVIGSVEELTQGAAETGGDFSAMFSF